MWLQIEVEYHLAASDTVLPTLLQGESNMTSTLYVRRAATKMCLFLAIYTCFDIAVRTMYMVNFRFNAIRNLAQSVLAR